MTKSELIKAVHATMPDRTKKEVGEIVGAVFAEVAKAVQVHKRLSYPGFGTFTVETRAARQGRNPRTGAAIAIAASKEVAFKAAPALESAPPVEDADEASAAQAGMVLELSDGEGDHLVIGLSEADADSLATALMNALNENPGTGEDEDAEDEEGDEDEDEEDAEDEEDEGGDDEQQDLSDDITVRFCFMKSDTDSPDASWFGEDELKDMRSCFSMLLSFQDDSTLPDDVEIESLTILYDGVSRSWKEDSEDQTLGFYLKGHEFHGYPAPIIRFRLNRQVDPTAFAGSVMGSSMGLYTRKMREEEAEEHVLSDGNGYTKALSDEERDDWVMALRGHGVFFGKTLDFRLCLDSEDELTGEAFIAPSTPDPLASHPPTWRADCGEDQHGRWAELIVAGVTLRFRYCPAGTFQMGSPASESPFGDEARHEVHLKQGFWLGETPVTERQWEAVTGRKPRLSHGMDRPAVGVSWEDCVAFVGKLNACCPELDLRLPTEAEWEYACRAGTTGPTYLGANDRKTLDKLAWYEKNSGGEAHPVGQKAPNAWGLYDTLGNVFEWCADWYAKYPSRRQVDPTGPSRGTNRVIRGGSWSVGASGVRAASRNDGSPGACSYAVGFRLARSSTLEVPRGVGDERGLTGEGFIAPSTPAPLASHPPTWRADCGEDPHGRWAELAVAGVTLRFRYCPAGTFQMGSPDGQGRENEHPLHEVHLTKGFWLSETPVTQRQWEAVTGRNPSKVKSPDRPVVQVSWEDCVAFLGTLNACCPELDLRLPTEAEWEYACRAGTTGPTYLGDNDAPTLDRLGWYEANSERRMHPVGQKAPNAWGLYDTLGNVWEWCADWYGKYPSGPQVDPTGPSTGTDRVGRGAARASSAATMRAAYRSSTSPGGRYDGVGFRVARSGP